MWSRLIKLPPIHEGPCRDWNQRTVIVEYALPRSLGTNNNLTVDLSQRISAFSPLPFNAAVETQWINGTHRSISLTRSCVRMIVEGLAFSRERSRGDLEGSKGC